MGQESICGLAIVETECREIEIQKVKVLDFQIWFLDQFLDYVAKIEKPKIQSNLFVPKENAKLQIVITPVTFTNLIQAQTMPRQLLFRIDLTTNKTSNVEAYSDILFLHKVVVNIIEVIGQLQSLTYSLNSSITNSNESVLALTINKIT